MFYGYNSNSLLFLPIAFLVPGLDVGKVQDKLTEASAKLQMCMQSASEWKPKLKSGMETTREYRKHLGIMQRWLQQSEQILTRPLDDDTPKELMTECQVCRRFLALKFVAQQCMYLYIY